MEGHSRIGPARMLFGLHNLLHVQQRNFVVYKEAKKKSLETGQTVARFLGEGAASVGVETIHVIFHGGEPTMMRLSKFEAHCETLLRIAGESAKVRFSL